MLTLPVRPPSVGDLVQVRSRRWLFEEVILADNESESPVVRLAYADDDIQGQTIEVYWNYEIERRILEAEDWAQVAAKGFALEKVVLHAKATVVDDESVFVASANLTGAAFDRNIELGLLHRDPAFARAVSSHFRKLIETKRLVRLPDTAS